MSDFKISVGFQLLHTRFQWVTPRIALYSTYVSCGLLHGNYKFLVCVVNAGSIWVGFIKLCSTNYICVDMYCVLICHSCMTHHLDPSGNCLLFQQNGLSPVALASNHGHSDLVDVLVKQYGCSMSDTVKVKHVMYGMPYYQCFPYFSVFISEQPLVLIECCHLSSSANLFHEFWNRYSRSSI